jgi:CRP-like cAMP-binding protein
LGTAFSRAEKMLTLGAVRSEKDAGMTNPFVRKLEYGAELTCEDRELLERVSAKKIRVPAGHDIINEGDNPTDTHLIMGGFACRYKQLQDGNRQIMALLLSGDL